jgi:hypothetical protein
MTDAAGMSGDEWLETSFAGFYLMLAPDPGFNLALAPLLMDLLKKSDQLPDFVLAGVLFALTHTLMAKPAVVELLLDEHDAVAAFVGFIRRSEVTPAELVAAAGFSRRPHGTIMHAMKDLIEGAQAIGRDLTAQLLGIGYIDLLVESLRSVPEVGCENCNGVVCAWGYMRTLNVIFGEKIEEIEEKIREETNALRYVIDNNVIFMAPYGLQSSTMGMICAANLFGKDEDNTFGITREEVDSFIDLDAELMACNSWGGIVAMGPNQARGLLKLCISDTNKEMLIESPGFVEHMIASLMLDPKHKRHHGTSQATKARVQRDYAECIQQISLFPSGCEVLKDNSAVVEALDSLATKGWSDEAKQCAHAALMQLCPERIKRSEQTGDGNGTQANGGHVMVSYQWDVQETIQRLVKSLMIREYNVWFDLTNMKGSIMDAMAEAVDGADVVLYCVSEAYKESANCRMEANYAHQQKKLMIPLMVQKGYNANGWLGLLLGTAVWFPMYGLEDADGDTFQAKVDPIVKAIGDRGHAKHSGGGDLSKGAPPKVAPARTRVRQRTDAGACLRALRQGVEPTPTPEPAAAPARPARASAPRASAPLPPALAATPTTPNRTAVAPVAQDTHSFTESMQRQMSMSSNAPGMPYGSAQHVAGSLNTSGTPLRQRFDGPSSSLTDLETLLESMRERDAEQRQHMTELTQMMLAREDKHADRMERMLQLLNDSAPRSLSTPAQTPPAQHQQHQQHQGRHAVSNTHDDVRGNENALVALMGALGLPGWLVAHRAWLGRIVVAVTLLRWRPLLRLLSRLGGV